MNCTPCRIVFEGTIELLLMLSEKGWTPEAKVKARQVAASLSTAEIHIANQALGSIFDMPPERDKIKEAKCVD